MNHLLFFGTTVQFHSYFLLSQKARDGLATILTYQCPAIFFVEFVDESSYSSNLETIGWKIKLHREKNREIKNFHILVMDEGTDLQFWIS